VPWDLFPDLVDVSTIVLLATSATMPLAVFQLDFMVEGRYESGAVVGAIIVGITTVAALLAGSLDFGSALPITNEIAIGKSLWQISYVVEDNCLIQSQILSFKGRTAQ
jgi:hypothetical protein